jgi:hypothetical protein
MKANSRQKQGRTGRQGTGKQRCHGHNGSSRKEQGMRIETIKKQIEKMKTKIAADRDKLRELQDEAEGIADSCDYALSNLESAVDALSEMV